MRSFTVLGLLLLAACSESKEPGPKAPVSSPPVSAAVVSDAAPTATAPVDEPVRDDHIVSLRHLSSQRGAEGWEVKVEVSFHNRGDKSLSIDKATGCEGGRIRNHVFRVTHEGAEIDYQGIMAKRAHPGPDGFWVLEPGASHSEVVELGSVYELPASGRIEVAFDHFNHFSVDEVQLTSAPLEIELAQP